MSVYYELAQLPTCCGVKEMGGFEDEDEDSDSYADNVSRYAESFPDWQAALDNLMGGAEKGIVIQAWFVRRRNYNGDLNDEYDNNALRLLVQQLPGVMNLHTGINPNSENEIDGYMWTVQ